MLSMTTNDKPRPRVFCALMPQNPAFTDAIAVARNALTEKLGTVAERVDWEEQPHLTLRFFGEMERRHIVALLTHDRQHNYQPALTLPLRSDGDSDSPHPSYLALANFGLFPGEGSRRAVLYADVAGDLDGLYQCFDAVQATATAMNLPPMEFPFHPHITLGRLPKGMRLDDTQSTACRVLHDAIAGVKVDCMFEAGYARLYCSERTEAGVEYRLVADDKGKLLI